MFPKVTLRTLKLACVWLLLFAGASGCVSVQLGPEIEPFEEKTIFGKGADKALLMDIHGMISNHERRTLLGFQNRLGMVDEVREIIQQAEKDDSIKALIVRINSPGGTVTASDIIYNQIKGFKKKNGIRVYVSMVDLATSGGYYIAMAGDSIMAHPTSVTGSIGVIALKVNLQQLMDKVGVDWEVVKSGDKKDFMSPFRPFTEEERKLFQQTINSFHHRFVKIVAENRPGLQVENVDALADGRVYTSQEAVDLKLIDRIGYLDDTVEQIKNDLEIQEIKVVTYHRPGEYKTNLYSKVPSSPTVNMVNIDLGLDTWLETPQFMYLWLQ